MDSPSVSLRLPDRGVRHVLDSPNCETHPFWPLTLSHYPPCARSASKRKPRLTGTEDTLMGSTKFPDLQAYGGRTDLGWS